MTPYERFINPRYVKLFNAFLDKVIEPKLRKEIYASIKLKMKLYGISIRPKEQRYYNIPIEELTDRQATVYFFIDLDPDIKNLETTLINIMYKLGEKILGLGYMNFYNYQFSDETFKAILEINKRPLYELDYQSGEPLNEDIEPSDRAKKNICDSEKFCKAQGKITFGQLRALVENAKTKKILTDVGEGGYKATLRLLPWFFPQLAIAGFTGSVIRAFNKVFRPALEDTTGYKTWWGKTIMKIFNMVEGELGITDPLSKIFFISDGLLTMLDNKEKIKFARHIAEETSKKPDDEEVPEFYVENELRHWVNEKFLLDPPLQPKEVKGERLNESQYDYEDSEEYYEKIDKLLNKFLSTTGKEKNIPNFLGYRVITGKNRYGEFTVKLTGIFKEPFRSEDSDTIHTKSRKMTKLIKQMFPFLSKATFYGGSTSTLDSYERNLDWEKHHLNRKVKDEDEDDELPFLQEEKNGTKRRLFKENIDSHELKWHFDELDRNVKVVKSNGWLLQMDNEIPVNLTEGKTFFIPKGVYHRVIKGQGDLVVEIKEMKENVILERKKHKYSGEIGNIVKDIIKVFKDNVDGEFYLPEDVNKDEMVYEFPKLGTSFSVELKIETNENIETFRTNAAIWHDDETISIVIQYNPKNKKTILYDLIGDLNQNIAHEIRHIYQKHFGTFNLDKPEEEPYEYYTQPEEIDAQVFGFKRLASLSKKPYESIVRQWFNKNKDIHQLSDKEAEMVIGKLLEYK
jgi:hypothetical protein